MNNKNDFYNEESLTKYQNLISILQERYSEYPFQVTFDLLNLCNATCNFCPYDSSSRKGEKMSGELFEKILHDLGEFPNKLPIRIVLSSLSEPLLNKDIFDAIDKVKTVAPQARIPFYTNGSPLNGKIIDKFAELENIMMLNVSLNECEPEKYEHSMGLSWDLIMNNLRLLHDEKVNGNIAFPVTLSRVASNNLDDDNYVAFVENEFPMFNPALTEPFNWLGSVSDLKTSETPDIGCAKWFQIHICSDGKVAFCCLDANGDLGKYNVKDESILEIYNKPELRQLRVENQSRVGHPICGGCTLGIKKAYSVKEAEQN